MLSAVISSVILLLFLAAFIVTKKYTTNRIPARLITGITTLFVAFGLASIIAVHSVTQPYQAISQHGKQLVMKETFPLQDRTLDVNMGMFYSDTTVKKSNTLIDEGTIEVYNTALNQENDFIPLTDNVFSTSFQDNQLTFSQHQFIYDKKIIVAPLNTAIISPTISASSIEVIITVPENITVNLGSFVLPK